MKWPWRREKRELTYTDAMSAAAYSPGGRFAGEGRGPGRGRRGGPRLRAGAVPGAYRTGRIARGGTA